VYLSEYKFLRKILYLLQLVTWFPKTVLGGGAWKMLKMKGGLNKTKKKSLGNPLA
jgi:hypothetical protein